MLGYFFSIGSNVILRFYNSVSIPIIIMHKGDSFYLSHTIAQARASNPNSIIYLIGDAGSAYYSGITHINYKNYFDEAAQFESVFENINNESRMYSIQLFLFQKHIVLRSFLRKNNIQQCFLIDTDVLIYESLHKYSPYFKNFEMTVSYGTVANYGLAHPGSMFINNVNILDSLIAIIYEIFKPNSELNQKIRAWADGVSEMNALGILHERFPELVGNTNRIIDNWAIQHTMLTDTYVEREKDHVKIYWDGNRPYGIGVGELAGKQIYFPVLHFHGHLKKIMYKHLKLNFKERSLWLYNVLKYKLFKYPKRYINLFSRRIIFPKA